MSVRNIVIIPAAPAFVPSEEAQRLAIELFRKLEPEAREIKAETSKIIRFFDCGENFERILCPNCKRELDLEFWKSWMHQEAEADFPLHAKPLPCCAAMLALDELIHEGPEGFARFSLEANDPYIADLTRDDLNQFEKILGCRVRKILQHY